MKNILTIGLLIPGMLVLSCKKQKSPGDYANKMNGVHKWNGTYDYSYNPAGGLSSSEHRIIHDSTIEIQVYDNYIIFGATSLPFESLNTTAQIMRYSLNDPSNLSFYAVTYYYEADSITYRFSQTLGHTGAEYLNMKTP
jgi:hypothetical protein